MGWPHVIFWKYLLLMSEYGNYACEATTRLSKVDMSLSRLGRNMRKTNWFYDTILQENKFTHSVGVVWGSANFDAFHRLSNYTL